MRARVEIDLDERRRPEINNAVSEPGGYIQWGEWDVNTSEIIRIPSAPSQSNDELERLREWTSTLGKTKPGPSFISSGFVDPVDPLLPLQSFSSNSSLVLAITAALTVHRHSWITRLPTTFAENGLSSIVVDSRNFAPEVTTLLLDTWMMASQEISTNVLDKLGGGRGDVARGLVEEVGRNRENTAFNVQRVVTIGRKED